MMISFISFLKKAKMLRSAPAYTWAINRTENYPNIDNFQPYDMAVCALLDSYYPEKINFSSLDSNNHLKNLELSIKVMEELGIQIMFYPDELIRYDKIERKILLTQLAAIKYVLDPNKPQ